MLHLVGAGSVVGNFKASDLTFIAIAVGCRLSIVISEEADC